MIRENKVTRIGVISDTHIPTRAQTLPPEVLKIFSGCDFIIHCGDAVEAVVFSELNAAAPVYAVRGNMDTALTTQPQKLLINVNEKFVLAAAHGHGTPFGIKDMLIREFAPQHPSLILFGHTHTPEISEYSGYKFFNPGSPCCGRGGMNSVGIINVTIDGIFPEIVKL
jgi:uncharacterized protein